MGISRPKIVVPIVWNKYGGGGVERATIELFNNLVSDFEIYICLLCTTDSIKKTDYFDPRIHVEHIVASRARYTFFALVQYIKRIKPDCIFSAFTHVSFLLVFIRLFLKTFIPLFVVHHGIDVKHKITVFQMFVVTHVATVQVAVSWGLKEFLQKRFFINKNRISCIYNPVDLKSIEKKASEVDESINVFRNKNKKSLIFVGRLEEEKDLYSLFQAVHMVVYDYHHPVNLFIIGDGSLRHKCELWVRQLKLEAYVFFLGWKKNPYAYIVQSNALVLVSRREGFPTVLLEAMALGIPVVSTDCDFGPAEIVGKNEFGILVPVGDVAGIAKGIIRILETPFSHEKLKKRVFQLCGNQVELYRELFENIMEHN